VQQEFGREQIEVQRFPASDGTAVGKSKGFATSARYARALTLRRSMREARRRGAKALVVFEDDVRLAPGFESILKGIELPEDWGLLYFGAQHLQRPQRVGTRLVRVAEAVDLHAVAMRSSYFEEISQALAPDFTGRETGRMCDRVIASLQHKIPTYAAVPNLAWQAESHSDLVGRSYSWYHEDGKQRDHRQCVEGMDQEWPGVPDTPWMHTDEMRAINHYLKADMTMIEYGAGGSTLYFAPKVARYFSVEYQTEWFWRTKSAVENRNLGHVQMALRPPEFPQEHPHLPALPGQFASFSNYASKTGEIFDAGLIDGRARIECAINVAPQIRPGGYLFIHDYCHRERYTSRLEELRPFYELVETVSHTEQTLAVFKRNSH